MFTGIVQGLGKIVACQKLGREARFRILPAFVMENIIDGESIAINGVCLSVETHNASSFTAYASSETMGRTNLSELNPGAMVNLERALKAGERLGGHLVSGHIDCLAIVRSLSPAGESMRCALTFPSDYAPEVIEKGSVALNGISLTINACGQDFLEVNVIPDSLKRTNMPQWRIGSRINMETDMIGKYVLHAIKPWESASKAPGTSLDRSFLAMNGFL